MNIQAHTLYLNSPAFSGGRRRKKGEPLARYEAGFVNRGEQFVADNSGAPTKTLSDGRIITLPGDASRLCIDHRRIKRAKSGKPIAILNDKGEIVKLEGQQAIEVATARYLATAERIANKIRLDDTAEIPPLKNRSDIEGLKPPTAINVVP